MMKMNKEEFEKARKLLLKNAEKLMQVKAPETEDGVCCGKRKSDLGGEKYEPLEINSVEYLDKANDEEEIENE